MDFEALRQAWRSHANNPSEAASAYIMAQVLAEIERRRTGLRRYLVFTGVALAIPLALLGWELVSGQGDVIDLRSEWALVPFALIPFIALIAIVLRANAPARAPKGSLIDTFRVLRADNGAARLRVVIVGSGLAVSAPFLGVMLNQLVAAGKMAPHEMQSAAVVLGGALALSAAWMLVKYLVQLASERLHLDALIAQYEVGA